MIHSKLLPLALLAFCPTLLAGQFGNFTYAETGDSITITGFVSNVSGPLEIPESIGGKPVTEIGDNAFVGMAQPTSLTIPDSVIRIGSKAFWGCRRLASVKLGSGVSNVGESAFHSCERLEEINIPPALNALSSGMFSDCGKLDLQTVPETVTRIEDHAFSQCWGMTRFTIPKTVQFLGQSVFWSCAQLEEVTIEEGIQSIPALSFASCSSLRKVVIPESVTSIGIYAFEGCGGLKSVKLPSQLETIQLGVFRNCSSLEAVVIPPNVHSLEYQAFFGCSNLRGISIPESVTSMEDWVFGGCDSLVSFTLPTSITKIPDRTFWECRSLSILAIPGHVTSIGESAFEGCFSLRSIKFHPGVTELGNRAFYWCTGLISAVFQGNAPLIGDEAFNLCAKGFSIHFQEGAAGFTTPLWNGYPAGLASPEIAVIEPQDPMSIDGEIEMEQGYPLDFGSVAIGTPSTITLKVWNNGGSDLSGFSFAISGTHSDEFTVVKAPSQPIIPGTYSFFTIRFVPGKIGNRSAALHVHSNDSDENPIHIRLAGAGNRGPEIAVWQTKKIELRDGVSYSFGTVGVRHVSVTREFTIRNKGVTPLTNIKVTKSGRDTKCFKVIPPALTTVQPGGRIVFSVTFNPLFVGRHKASLRISSSDRDESDFDFTMIGEGEPMVPSFRGVFGGKRSSGGGRSLMDLHGGRHTQFEGTIEINGSRYRTLTIPRFPGDTSPPSRVEVSANLIEWRSGRDHTTVLVDDKRMLKVRDNVPIALGKKRFIRLRPL